MRKSITSLLVIILLLAASCAHAFAHVLDTDGAIGAVLHVDPNDEPIAGQQSAFFFEFKDTQNKFTPQKCDCTFSVSEDGNVIYTQPLFANNNKPSLSNASVFYTFPQKDVYQISVVGKPNTPHAFQPFTLTWNWRVDQATGKTTEQGTNSSHVFSYIIIGVLVCIGLGWIIGKSMVKKENKK